MRVGCKLSVAHYTEGQCDGCVPQYGNLDKPVFKVVMKHVFFLLLYFFFVFVLFSFRFSVICCCCFLVYIHLTVNANIQLAAKRRSIIVPLTKATILFVRGYF